MQERIRVLHSLAAISTGGVERRRLLLARLLDGSQYEQRIMARGVSGSIVSELERNGVKVVVLGGGSVFARRPLLRAAREALRFRPHIVHGAVFEGLGPAVLAGRISGARVVIEETSHATNRSWRGHALFRALAAASDACVAISPAVGAYLSEVTKVPKRKVTVIPNGVVSPVLPDRETIARLRDSLGLPAAAFVVGTVGRLEDDDHKRVSDLIQALTLILPGRPHVRLLVVGEGRERRMLERRAKAAGVSESIVFAGHRDDVGSMYALMDVFALASSREGFGLVLPEAMLCGLPVVASAVGGIPDIVVDGQTGILVPPCNPAAFADAIVRLEARPELRSLLGSAGRHRAELHFSAERYAADVDAFYRALLQRR